MSLAARLEELFGARVAAVTPLSASYGLEVLRVDLADGRCLVVKHGAGPRPGHLPLEGWMLERLAGELPVPRLHHVAGDLLVMDHLAGGPPGPACEADMARHLARLHGERRPFFGLERDTSIGPLPQPNPPTDRWLDFFRDHRLLFMARRAAAAGRIGPRLLARIERLAADLERHVAEPAWPALLHGDVWSGNVLCRAGRVTGFIDPALQYGHPELELAFMTMFATVGDRFFAAYGELRPEFDPAGFAERREIWLIWPHLTHVLIEGPSYAGFIDWVLARRGY